MTRKVLLIIVAVLCSLGVILGISVTFEHLNEPGFPDHARFHAGMSGIYIVLVSLAALGLVVQGLRGARCGALLLFAVVAVPLGSLVAALLVPEGAPPAPFPLLAAFGAILAAITAGMLWRIDRRSAQS
jgi:uncharacterized membrane protein YhaH (DUF805 family)